MSAARKLFVSTSSLVGGITGRIIAPTIAGPIARTVAHKTMNFMWGPAQSFLSSLARKGIAEHIGHQAFKIAMPIGSVVGGASTALAAQGAWKLGAYAIHLQKNRSFLQAVEKHGLTEKGNIEAFELSKKEGFRLA